MSTLKRKRKGSWKNTRQRLSGRRKRGDHPKMGNVNQQEDDKEDEILHREAKGGDRQERKQRTRKKGKAPNESTLKKKKNLGGRGKKRGRREGIGPAEDDSGNCQKPLKEEE